MLGACDLHRSGVVVSIERAVFDTETRSHCDISRGLDVYVNHHTTQLVCAALETDRWKCAASFIPSSDGREMVEVAMRALGLTVVPPETLVAMLRATKTAVAHNFAFDQAATRALAGVHIPDDQWSCTMSRAMRHGLPGGLGNLCEVLGFGDQGKDKEGNRLMKQIMKPRPAWSKWARTHEGNEPPMWFEDADRIAREVLYCARDVSATARVDRTIPELEPEERAIWLHVHDMNCRGIPLDTQLIQGAIAISEEAQRDLQDRIRHYTGGMIQSLKAPGQLQAWARRYGYETDSWNKENVIEMIADPRCPEPVKVVARARQEAARGSVAKYETASDMVSADGRLRHQLLYAGTSTLRLAGRGVQPLNLPRPKIEADKSAALADIKAGREIRVPQWKIDYDPERALDAIRRGDLTALRGIGDPEEILSDNIRGMIKAPQRADLTCSPTGRILSPSDYAKLPALNDKIIVSPDLSAIEARGVFWLVDCEKALQAYRAGECLYCQLASTMFGFTVKKKENPEERQYGKVGILQCFEADTGVLTRDRGVVPIIKITSGDLVWDGIEWVRHAGVVARGRRLTTNFRGVKVTPDHLIMTRQGWRTVSDLQQNPQRSENDLAIWSSAATRADAGPIVDFAIPDEVTSGANASAGGFARRSWKTLKKVARRAVILARNESLAKHKWFDEAMRLSFLNTHTVCGGFVGTGLCLRDHTMERIRRLKTIKTAASWSRLSGWMPEIFSHGFVLSPIGTGPNTAWIEKKSTARMHHGIADWRLPNSNLTTNAVHIASNTKGTSILRRDFTRWFARGWRRLLSHVSHALDGPAISLWPIRSRDVYDVADAGPRHRFTIVTPDGRFLLVHNCGYGSGATKVAMANKLDDEMAQRIVSTYRSDYSEVPAAWRDLERSAINALHHPGVMMDACNGKVHFVYEGGWLRIRRPSGTWMYLPDAGVDYEGRLYYHAWIKGAWREESIWGGVLINFVVQGFCRELMYSAEMRLAQDPRFELFLQCYDSLSALVDADQGKELCDVMIREMTTPPAWAPDMPLAAEGKPKMRYS